jgi:cytochrome P450
VSELDLTNPDHVRDPYPVLARLRAEDPVHWSEKQHGWVLTRYDDVRAVIKSDHASADTITPFLDAKGGQEPDADRVGRFARLWAVFNDPPDHTRLRNALNRGFGARQVAALAPMIADLVDGLVDGLAAQRHIDLVGDVAFPLPAMVIARMLGVPEQDIHQVRGWSEDLGQFIATSPHPDRYRRASAAMVAMADYFRDLVADHPGPEQRDDILGHLLGGRRLGIFRTDDELVANCVLLLFAGHETTTNLLANGTYHLLRHPDQYERLRSHPELVPLAVEELLRFDGPVHALTRVVARDLERGGRRLRAGDRVFAFLTAANRDPEVFPEPDRLDIERHPNPVLSFGYGIHFCLGAPLARLEARIALPRILARLRGLRLLEEPRWKPLLVLRSIESLPVAFTSAA